MIKYLPHAEINAQKWDVCISSSFNKLPYALSWWLDSVCPDWDAIVLGDYEAVMPLTRGRKWGFDYLYQPYFTQQLGIFSPEPILHTLVSDFLAAIPSSFKFISIQLNKENYVIDTDYHIGFRKNFQLDLSANAVSLAAGYHRNCRRNIQRAVQSGCSIVEGPMPPVFTVFIEKNLERQLSGIRRFFYPSLLRVTSASVQHQCGEIVGIHNRSGELQAAAWFIITMNRCLFLVCASTPAGKENQAMSLIVDHMIRKHAGSRMVFDFAGSNLPGIAYFNAGFGASETLYPVISRNTLPLPFKLFKH